MSQGKEAARTSTRLLQTTNMYTTLQNFAQNTRGTRVKQQRNLLGAYRCTRIPELLLRGRGLRCACL